MGLSTKYLIFPEQIVRVCMVTISKAGEFGSMTEEEAIKRQIVGKESQPQTNPMLVSMQIEAMQLVLRRMRASRGMMLDPITNEKLSNIANQ